MNFEYFSETISPAAAFKQIAFEKSLSSPLNTSIILLAFYLGSSPNKFSNLSAFIFNSFGSIVILVISPFFS